MHVNQSSHYETTLPLSFAELNSRSTLAAVKVLSVNLYNVVREN
jgi:hypothetical protein